VRLRIRGNATGCESVDEVHVKVKTLKSNTAFSVWLAFSQWERKNQPMLGLPIRSSTNF
jgi:hypothetical protein